MLSVSYAAGRWRAASAALEPVLIIVSFLFRWFVFVVGLLFFLLFIVIIYSKWEEETVKQLETGQQTPNLVNRKLRAEAEKKVWAAL